VEKVNSPLIWIVNIIWRFFREPCHCEPLKRVWQSPADIVRLWEIATSPMAPRNDKVFYTGLLLLSRSSSYAITDAFANNLFLP
jgi:hypothetical protein